MSKMIPGDLCEWSYLKDDDEVADSREFVEINCNREIESCFDYVEVDRNSLLLVIEKCKLSHKNINISKTASYIMSGETKEKRLIGFASSSYTKNKVKKELSDTGSINGYIMVNEDFEYFWISAVEVERYLKKVEL